MGQGKGPESRMGRRPFIRNALTLGAAAVVAAAVPNASYLIGRRAGEDIRAGLTLRAVEDSQQLGRDLSAARERIAAVEQRLPHTLVSVRDPKTNKLSPLVGIYGDRRLAESIRMLLEPIGNVVVTDMEGRSFQQDPNSAPPRILSPSTTRGRSA